jgi:hypothetical protein
LEWRVINVSFGLQPEAERNLAAKERKTNQMQGFESKKRIKKA